MIAAFTVVNDFIFNMPTNYFMIIYKIMFCFLRLESWGSHGVPITEDFHKFLHLNIIVIISELTLKLSGKSKICWKFNIMIKFSRLSYLQQ